MAPASITINEQQQELQFQENQQDTLRKMQEVGAPVPGELRQAEQKNALAQQLAEVQNEIQQEQLEQQSEINVEQTAKKELSLGGQELNLSEEVKERLNQQHLKERTLSANLISSTKILRDSKEMTRVKNSVMQIEAALQEQLAEGTNLTEYSERLENLYSKAISYCQYYLANKTTMLGNTRYLLVRDKMTSLLREMSLISSFKQKCAGLSDEVKNSIPDGMAILRLTNIERQIPQVSEEKAAYKELSTEEKLAQDATIESFNGPAKMILDLLLGKTTPMNVSKEMGVDGMNIAKAICSLLQSYPGGAHTEYIHTATFAYKASDKVRKTKDSKGKTITCNGLLGISQEADGTMALSHVSGKNIKKINIPFRKEHIIMSLQQNMIENESVFGEDYTNQALSWIKKDLEDMPAEDVTRLRRACVELLAKRSGLPVTEFRDVPLRQLQKVAVDIINNKTDPQFISVEVLSEKTQTVKLDSDAAGDNADDEMLEYMRTHNSEWTLIEKADDSKKLINNLTVMESLEFAEKHKELKKELVTMELAPQQKKEEAADGEEPEEIEEWSEEEIVIKNFIADLIYSKDTWNADNLVKAGASKGERVKKVLSEHSAAIALIVKNRELVNNMFDRMPIPVGIEEMKAEINKAIDGLLPTGAIEKAAIMILSQEKIAEQIKDTINELSPEELASIEENIDSTVEEGTEMIQAEVEAAVSELFKKDDNEPTIGKVGDPDAPGITPEEKAKRISLGEQKLNQMMQEAMTGDSGPGLFTKNVLSHYFTEVSLLDKRSMLASAMRSVKPVSKEQTEMLKLIREKEKDIAEREKKLKDEKEGKEEDKGLLGGFFSGFANLFAKKDPEAEKKAKEEEIAQKEKKLNLDKNIQKHRQEVYEKQVKDQAGSFVGGFLKGAGPLLQKLLQGIPMNDSAPQFLQDALKDVKSRLLPIPQEIVDAQLLDMVQSSKGEVTKITITRMLGAASVGQAFMCKIYGPSIPEDGREVVVKILRPDVQNRMAREKEILLRCAEMTNAGMRETYLGQLKRIEEELDLKIEARNVKLGAIYDKTGNEDGSPDNVEAMKLCPLIEPTAGYMVIEKSEGDTVDHYLEDIDEQTVKDLKPFLQEVESKNENKEEKDKKKQKKKPEYVKDDGIYKLNINENNRGDVTKAIQKIDAMITESVARQEHLIRLSEKWVTEGLFGEGFYHGDLHAGNIMVSRYGATFIDFGNATKLSEEDKVQITRMMVGATIGDVKLFRNGFHELMEKTPDSEATFKKELKRFDAKIKEVFSLGSPEHAGLRIGAVLLKAQELGLALPSSIQNFSNCQIRLENTVTNMNKHIEDLKKLKNKLLEASTRSTVTVDPASMTAMAFREDKKHAEGIRETSKRTIIDRFMGSDKEEFINRMLEFDYTNQATYSDLTDAFNSRYFFEYGTKTVIKNYMEAVEDDEEVPPFEESSAKIEIDHFLAKKESMHSPDYPDKEAVYELIKNPTEENREAREKLLEDIANTYTNAANDDLLRDAVMDCITEATDFKEAHPEGGKFEFSQKARDKWGKFFDIYREFIKRTDYNVVAPSNSSTNSAFEKAGLVNLCSSFHKAGSIERFKEDYKAIFEDPKYGAKYGAILDKQAEAYYTYKNSKDVNTLNDKEKEAFFAELTALANKMAYTVQLVSLLMVENMKTIAEGFQKEHKDDSGSSSLDNFIAVMGRVIRRNVPKAVKRLGVIWTLFHKSKIEGMAIE